MNNGIFNIEPVLARTQILVHTRGAMILPLFCRRTYPKSLVPSVPQANIKGVGLVLHQQTQNLSKKQPKG